MRRIALVIFVMALDASTAHADAPTLSISPNGRHLIDETGRAFLLTGDSAWSLFAEPTMAEVELYLEDRAARGFNFVAANLIEHRFTTNPPKNADGVEPFSAEPFVTPNETYFARCDDILSLASSLGIVILLNPAYQGWNCTTQGWCEEIEEASLSDMRDWGRYVGDRYKDFPNIIWSIGGDWDPTQIADEYREMVAGIREFDTTHLISAHNHRETQAVTYWPGEAWLDVNNVFAPRDALYQHTLAAYDHSPVMPFFLLEAYYENEYNNTHQELRAQAYWSVLTGAFGVVFGNCPIWHFGYSSSWCGLTNWVGELDEPGSVHMTHYRDLFESRRWHRLVPDSENETLTAGMGVDGSENYAFAAVASDGSSIIAYVPTPRQLTFDTTALSGSTVRAWWFDPSDATATLVGDYPGGNLVIPTGPAGDNVLVLDDAAIGFDEPGIPLITAVPAPPLKLAELEQNEPNPFNPSTSIRFRLTRAAAVRLTIHDATGRLVRTLLAESRPAGTHDLHWDARDERGQRLGSGVYFYRLRADDELQTRKMLLLK